MESSKALIIAAAGSGIRMRNPQPKPFIQLSGKTILEHTLGRFLSLKGLQKIVVATSQAGMEQAEAILQQCLPPGMEGQCIEGGAERQQSIHQALKEVSSVDLVLIHDAVRPFITPQQIQTCCKQAEAVGAAVAGIPAVDTIKKVDANGFVDHTPDRAKMWQIQTPQVFRAALLKEAYDKAARHHYAATDDASLVEWLGQPVKVVKTSRDNIKITYPQDLQQAELLLDAEKTSS